MRCGEPTRTIPSPGPGAPASPRHRSDEEATRKLGVEIRHPKAAFREGSCRFGSEGFLIQGYIILALLCIIEWHTIAISIGVISHWNPSSVRPHEFRRLARLDLDPWKAEPKLAMEGLKHLASRKGPLLVLQMIRSMQVANVRVDYFHCGVAISACNQRWQSAMQVLRCMRLCNIKSIPSRVHDHRIGPYSAPLNNTRPHSHCFGMLVIWVVHLKSS